MIFAGLLLLLSSLSCFAAAPNLLVWYNFEDDFADGKIDDVSGNNRHAWRFGRGGTNYLTRVSVTNSPGLRTNGFCGMSRWYNDGWGIYGRSGDYAGVVTNLGSMTNMTAATISLWARYFPATDIDPSYTQLNDQNATILSTGHAAGFNGSWSFGRFYSSETEFTVITNDATGTKIYFEAKFKDPSTSGKGNTTNWHHYAVVCDGTQATLYFDGLYCTNKPMTQPLKIHAFGNIKRWIGVGVDTHAGTPEMEDEVGEDYPNHAWFNGLVDDIRIYDGPMDSNQMFAVFQSSDIIPVDPGQTTNRVSAPTVRTRVIRARN